MDGGSSGNLANGIGSPTVTTANGAYTPEVRVRLVALSGGTGTLVLHKHAEGAVTGPMTSVHANAKGVLAVIDNRFVSIVTINGGWPTIPASTQENPIWFYTSDGNRHDMSYMGKVAVPAPLIYNGDYTDYSKWEIGLPLCTQTIEHFALGNTVTTPPDLEPRSVRLNAEIGFGPLGPRTPNSYSWKGSGRFTDENSGSLPIDGVWQIPAQNMTIFPDASIKEVMYGAQGIISKTFSNYTLMRGEDANYRLDFTFHDGITAQSKREVTYHSAVEPTEISRFYDENVNEPYVPAVFKTGQPNDTFKINGWATKGETYWPVQVKKANDKLYYGNEAISLIAAQYVGFLADLGGPALVIAWNFVVHQLLSFIDAQYPPDLDYGADRDAWKAPGNTFEVGPSDWYTRLTGQTSPPYDAGELLEEYISQFYWRFSYRPTLWRVEYTLDHYDTLGFQFRDIGERKIENDTRQGRRHYYFHLSPDIE